MNPVPLFSATHHTGAPPAQVSTALQPITTKPLVVKNTSDANYMVYFGTGQYIATGDATNTSQQSFYGILDAGAAVSATDLVEQTFETGFPADVRVLTQNPVDYSSGKLGWLINLPDSGEKAVVDAFILHDLLFFNTLIPLSAPCTSGGKSFLMAVEAKSGGNPTRAAFNISGDDQFDDADKVTHSSDPNNKQFASGIAFGHGIASATAVITNADGKSFGYISGTDAGSNSGTHAGIQDTSVAGLYQLGLPGAPGGGPAAIGIRHTWQQLFN
jgi:Tfp pilus tip-associated adhesin PilY1